MATFTPSWQSAAEWQQKMHNMYAQIHGTTPTPTYMGDPSKPYNAKYMDNAPNAAPEVAYAPGANLGVAPPNTPGVGWFGQKPNTIQPSPLTSGFFSALAQAGADLSRANEPLRRESEKLRHGGYALRKAADKAAGVDASRNRYSAYAGFGERGVTGRGGHATLTIANIMNELKRRIKENRETLGDLRVGELSRGIAANNKAAALGLVPWAAELGKPYANVVSALQNVISGKSDFSPQAIQWAMDDAKKMQSVQS